MCADIVIRVRPEAYQASFDALTNDVARVLVQLVKWQDAAPQSQQNTP
jgi:RNase P protein component